MAKYSPLKILTVLYITQVYSFYEVNPCFITMLAKLIPQIFTSTKNVFLLQKNKEYVSIAKGGFMGKLINNKLCSRKLGILMLLIFLLGFG